MDGDGIRLWTVMGSAYGRGRDPPMDGDGIRLWTGTGSAYGRGRMAVGTNCLGRVKMKVKAPDRRQEEERLLGGTIELIGANEGGLVCRPAEELTDDQRVPAIKTQPARAEVGITDELQSCLVWGVLPVTTFGVVWCR